MKEDRGVSAPYLGDNGAKEIGQLGLEDDNVDDNTLDDASEKATNLAHESAAGCGRVSMRG